MSQNQLRRGRAGWTFFGIGLISVAVAGCAGLGIIGISSKDEVACMQNTLAEYAVLNQRLVEAKKKPISAYLATAEGTMESLAKAMFPDSRDDIDNRFFPMIDLFLDCTAGVIKLSPNRDRKNESGWRLDAYRELLLLRGHMIVTTLAIYGEANVHGRQYDEKGSDAEAILASVQSAERHLRLGSSAFLAVKSGFTGNVHEIVGMEAPNRLARISTILQVSKAVETPTFHRLRGLVFNIVAAAEGSPGAILDVFKHMLFGIKKAYITMINGAAYRSAINSDLVAIEKELVRLHADGDKALKPEGLKMIRQEWARWDGHLNDACFGISTLTKSKAQCATTRDELNLNLKQNSYLNDRLQALDEKMKP